MQLHNFKFDGLPITLISCSARTFKSSFLKVSFFMTNISELIVTL